MTQYDATNRSHIRAATKQAKFRSSQRTAFTAHIMSTASGRGWMLELLERGHIFASTYSGNALAGAFAEGERNQALMLLNEIMVACPDQYVQMMRERDVKEITDGRRRDASNGNNEDRGSDGTKLVDPTGYDPRDYAGDETGDQDRTVPPHPERGED